MGYPPPPQVDLVIHCGVPSNADTFQHRSGRTGRAGRSGNNVVLFDPKVVGWEAMLQLEKVGDLMTPCCTDAAACCSSTVVKILHCLCVGVSPTDGGHSVLVQRGAQQCPQPG